MNMVAKAPPQLSQIGPRGVVINGDQYGITITGDGNTLLLQQLPSATSALLQAVPPLDEGQLLPAAVAEYQAELRVEQQASEEKQPYRGLAAYRLHDAAIFYGRKEMVVELQHVLEKARLVWLHGRSGTGKTSLIRAGVMPALLTNGVPVHIPLRGQDPTTTLKKEILQHRWSAELSLAKTSLLHFLMDLGRCLPGQTLYLFFDQFEEFFNRINPADRNIFAQELADCLSHSPDNLSVRFIFALRSEYFGDTYQLREYLTEFDSQEIHLPPLTTADARLAITEPVRVFGLTYAPDLVEEILAELDTHNISPQLQLICQQLHQAATQANSPVITRDHYPSQEGVKGILRDYLRQSLHNLPTRQRAVSRYLLVTLVTPEGKREYQSLQHWCTSDDLRPLLSRWYQENQAVDTPLLPAELTLQIRTRLLIETANVLSQQRLINATPIAEGDVIYELVHDYLTDEILSWLDQDEKAAHRIRRMLTQRQSEYQDDHRLLLSPRELDIVAKAVQEQRNTRLALTDEDRQFLLYSAALHNTAHTWLDVAGEMALAWLREACLAATLPMQLRKGVAACLGKVNDTQAYQALQEALASAQPQAKTLMVQYLHHAPDTCRLSMRQHWSIFPEWPLLQLQHGAAIRRKMRRAAIAVNLLCISVLILVTGIGSGDWLTGIGLAIIFGMVGPVTAVIYAEGVAAAMLTTRRNVWLEQLALTTLVGVLAGFPLYLLLSFEPAAALIGGIPGLVVALAYKHPLPRRSIRFASALLLGFLIAWLTRGIYDLDAWENNITWLLPSVFTAAFTYLIVPTVSARGNALTI